MSTRAHIENKLQILLLLFSVIFGGLWMRLFYLQVVRGDNLRKVAEANRTSILFERAPRGLIVDRYGNILADSKPTFVVLFTPLELKKDEFGEVNARLASVLDMNEEKLKAKLQPAIKHSSMFRVMDRASRSIAFALAEQRPNLPGVSVVTEMQRRYPNGTLAAHALGYLGQASPEELQQWREEGYNADWLVGKMGLERLHDRILRGEHGGMRLEVDATGHSLKILDRKKPISGYQLQLTLSLKVQQAAEEGLAEQGKPGAVVAMDPNTGEILAIASSPPFDPNLFLYTRGEQTENQVNPSELLYRTDLPLFNRAIQGTYPPGSVFKIIDTAAALETHRLGPKDTFFCPGHFWLGSGASGKKFMCWKPKGHGLMNLQEALINSCNVYFYQLSLKVGPDPIEQLARNFGMGKKTGFEFPGEKNGLIPFRNMFKDGRRKWFDGDTLNMGIGQGTVLFTPIQAAQLISAVANRGKIYRPHLVKEIRTPTGQLYAKSEPQLLHRLNFSDSTWDFLDDSLSQVVDRGTGQASKIAGVKLGGKTGTAQNPHGKDHGWFVCYGPVGNPLIAIAVLVEHGVKGSVAAAPIAKKVITVALQEAGLLPPDVKPAAEVPRNINGD